MNRSPIPSVLLSLCAVMIATAAFGGGKGHLFIIGGGERGPELMQEFIALAGGPGSAVIRIIPLASGDPREAGTELAGEFTSLGVKNVSSLLWTREEAEAEGSEKGLEGATGVYFAGGDQIRVTRVLLNTPVYKKLHQLYRDGAVLGGTSAGAAIMSRVMITGDETMNKDTVRNFVFMKKGNIERVEGMGFLDSVIIDQHFIKRKRYARLLSLAMEYPELVGVGIDESTAITVNPDRTFRVSGEGTVFVVDPTHARQLGTDAHGNLSGSNLILHILKAGDSFDMTTRTPRPAGTEK